ncbi:hypothetical protein B0H11DRAFT_2077725 [Mycena galericulata]|nr:hypothetical protein B0H11DRAFT_2077725 [Mycena galericulata]
MTQDGGVRARGCRRAGMGDVTVGPRSSRCDVEARCDGEAGYSRRECSRVRAGGRRTCATRRAVSSCGRQGGGPFFACSLPGLGMLAKVRAWRAGKEGLNHGARTSRRNALAESPSCASYWRADLHSGVVGSGRRGRGGRPPFSFMSLVCWVAGCRWRLPGSPSSSPVLRRVKSPSPAHFRFGSFTLPVSGDEQHRCTARTRDGDCRDCVVSVGHAAHPVQHPSESAVPLHTSTPATTRACRGRSIDLGGLGWRVLMGEGIVLLLLQQRIRDACLSMY